MITTTMISSTVNSGDNNNADNDNDNDNDNANKNAIQLMMSWVHAGQLQAQKIHSESLQSFGAQIRAESREHGGHSQCVANAIPVGVCPDGTFVPQPITLDPEGKSAI